MFSAVTSDFDLCHSQFPFREENCTNMASYNGVFMRFISPNEHPYAVNIGLWVTGENMHVWCKLPHAPYKIMNTQIHYERDNKNGYSNDIDLIEIEMQ